jgi:magnesium transporter
MRHGRKRTRKPPVSRRREPAPDAGAEGAEVAPDDSARRPALYKEQYHAPGTPPATLIASADAPAGRPRITLFEYDATELRECEVTDIREVFACRDNAKVSWINIDGLTDVELIRELGAHFHLHPLTLEDSLNTHQRPKMEEYDNHTFVVLQIPYAEEDHHLEREQLSLFLGETFVITLQEDPARDVFEPVRQRIRQGRGFARGMKNDYLAYMLIDAVVDHYFPVLENLGDGIEELEEEVLGNPGGTALRRLYDYKRILTQLRRFAWPQREVLVQLTREDVQLILPQTKVFLRDCVDHSMQILDVLESYRDLSAGMMDLYVSQQSQRTNEVMKVLTIMSSIFIPLTFVVGVYGMNFDPDAGPLSMPELRSPYGYAGVMLFMVAMAIGMLALFRRKRWL